MRPIDWSAWRSPFVRRSGTDTLDHGATSSSQPQPGRETLTSTAAPAQPALGNGERRRPRASGITARSTYLELISADVQQCAQRIHGVLRTGVGNLQNFELITPWLMGTPSAQLDPAYQQLAGTSLRDAITSAFGRHVFMRSYLLDVLDRGEPSLGSRLALASGLVTHTRSDWAEVLRLISKAKPSEVSAAISDTALRRRLETSTRVKTAIEAAVKQEAHDQATQAVTTAREAGDPAELAAAEHVEETSKQALYDAKNAELAALVRHRQLPTGGLALAKLVADLAAWAKRNERDVRDHAVALGSPFDVALAKAAAGPNLMVRLNAHDRAYLVATARGGAPVDDDVLKLDEPPSADAAESRTAEELAEEEEKRVKKREESAQKLTDIDAYIDWKAGSNHPLKYRRWSELKGKIEGLSDEERATYLRMHMTPDARAVFDAEDSTAEQRSAVRSQAMLAIRARLIVAGMSATVADRAMAALQTGAAPDSSKYHSTYQMLRRLAFGGPELRFSRRALQLVCQLSNQEYFQVRSDAALMTALQARCDAPAWRQITVVLGTATGTDADTELAGKEARESASNEAELSPAHWTALIRVELDHHAMTIHQDKLLSIATRAHYAAQRRAALPPGDEGRKAELPRNRPPIATYKFAAVVLAGLSSDEQRRLKRHAPAAYDALHDARAVTARERIAAAKFSMLNPKRLKGTGATPSDIKRAIEDTRGRELLEEWSNVATWRALQARRAERKAAPPGDDRDRALAEIDAKMRAFVVDVHPEVHAQLRGLLPRDKLLDVLTDLREKLGKAMADDPAFHAALLVAGLHGDDHAAERTHGVAALDRQHMEDSGMQWNRFMGVRISAKSAESKESRSLLAGQLRTAHGAIEAADDRDAARAQVNEEQVPKIKETREELADRMKAAQALKKRANEIATTVVTILGGIAITGATFGTGGLAFAPQIGIALAKALATGTLMALLDRALVGDKFNAVNVITNITMDLMMTSLMAGGLAAPGSAIAHAQASAGLTGKKDAGSIFASSAMRWAIATAVREAISTTSSIAMTADRPKLQLDQEMMTRLRAWVEDFGMNMAVTEANRHTAGQSQAEKDTTKLIPTVVNPVTSELRRPLDTKLKAERRVLGKDTVAEADLASSSGVKDKQLEHGHELLRVTEGPSPAPPATSAHGVTADELAQAHDQLRVTDGPLPAPPATSGHGVTADELTQADDQLRVTGGPPPAPPATTAHRVTLADLFRVTGGPPPAPPATTAHRVTLADLLRRRQ